MDDQNYDTSAMMFTVRTNIYYPKLTIIIILGGYYIFNEMYRPTNQYVFC